MKLLFSWDKTVKYPKWRVDSHLWAFQLCLVLNGTPRLMSFLTPLGTTRDRGGKCRVQWTAVFWTREGSSSHELPASVIICTRPAEHQTSQNPSMNFWEPNEVLPLAKVLLVIGGCWEGESADLLFCVLLLFLGFSPWKPLWQHFVLHPNYMKCT